MLLSRHTRRRDFIALLGGALAAWPPTARAQGPDRMRRIAVLMTNAEDDPEGRTRAAALRQSLQALGWTEGQNLSIDWRWSAADVQRVRNYVKEVAALAPDLIVANGAVNLSALTEVVRSIPIVFVIVNDPVGQGFIPNLARPGGNITGFSFVEYSMFGKSLELLKQIASTITRVGFIFNPDTTPYYERFLPAFEIHARHYPIELSVARIRSEVDIDAAVAKLAAAPGGGLIVPPDTYTVVHRGLIMQAAARNRLPAIFTYRQFVKEGALMAYGPDTADIFRRAASYVDRILKGANPGDLPAQAPAKFELAINLNTARVLGLDVPPTLLALADEVIE